MFLCLQGFILAFLIKKKIFSKAAVNILLKQEFFFFLTTTQPDISCGFVSLFHMEGLILNTMQGQILEDINMHLFINQIESSNL